MRSRAWLPVAAVLLAACGSSPGVFTQSAHRAADMSGPSTSPLPNTAPAPAPPATAPPTTTEPPPPPPTTTPATEPPPPPTTVPPRDLLVIDEAKPPRDYDALVRAALADLERWWSEQFPALYGAPFEPLTGGVYPAYPERIQPVPGCGGSESTTYEEISQYGAFYCQGGDFIVYDDGAVGILAELAAEFGPSIVGVVMAHEYGHVVQSRSGELERGLPTIITEQQADCFAGAWVARAVRGEAPGVPFTDADVRTGLVAMITVRDPLGVDQYSAGGHGSAFDRVGAFQLGFSEGLARCTELINAPLQLVPNEYSTANDQFNAGNAPFGFGQDDVGGFIVEDLNRFWTQTVAALGAELGPLTLVPVEEGGDVTCPEPAGDVALGAVYCASTNEVFYDATLGFDLYEQFGDFTVGYVLGAAWGEAVQQALGSTLAGEKRALLSDCLTGAWAADIVPTPEDPTPPGGVSISPGDLDEAIQTALVIGDESTSDDVVGSAFEKIASFRQGVLEGIPACTERLGG